jgi:cell wall-associated NlpC family hydrolase
MRRVWLTLTLCVLAAIPSDARKKKKSKASSSRRSTHSGPVVSYRIPTAVVAQEARGWMYASEVTSLGRARPKVDYSQAETWKLQPLASVVSVPESDDGEVSADSLMSQLPAGALSRFAASSDQGVVQRIRLAAEPYLGIPYKGRRRGVEGYDCSGFVRALLGDFGVALSGRSSQDYYLLGDQISPENLQPGDLVFFSDNARRVGHVGLYVDSGVFVHSALSKGITYSRMDEAWYQRRYQGARRVSTVVSGLQGGPFLPRTKTASTEADGEESSQN